jgi:predicted transcriptional regulator
MNRLIGIEFATPRLSEIALTVTHGLSKLTTMVVHLKPETESRLQELAASTGRAADELVENAMTGYLAELTQVRNMLDGRYDDIKSGRVQPVDGEEAFGRLRQKGRDRRRS